MNQADVNTSVLDALDFDASCNVVWTNAVTKENRSDENSAKYFIEYKVNFEGFDRELEQKFACDNCFAEIVALNDCVTILSVHSI